MAKRQPLKRKASTQRSSVKPASGFEQENAALRCELDEVRRQLAEALEQQTATSEVLKIISSSPGALEPVFKAILENACSICDATFGSMLVRDGAALRRVALHNAPEPFLSYSELWPLLERGKARAVDLAMDTMQVTHIADAAQYGDEPIAKLAGARTLLVVPMLKDASSIGVIGIYRQEVSPFTEKQIELVRIFPPKLSSRLKTRGCLTNCASAPMNYVSVRTTYLRRWNSKPRRLRC